MEINHNQFIGIYENFFDPSWCDKVVEIFNSQSNSAINRQDYWGGGRHEAKDSSLDLAQIYDLTKDPILISLHNYAQSRLHQALNLYTDNYSIPYLNEVFQINNYKVQKTQPTEGYHVWHYEYPHMFPKLEKLSENNKDNNSYNFVTRFAAYTIYLNDVEEGGETEFLNQKIRVKAKKGTLCVFPAYFTHLHRGNPPLASDKYIMTGWYHLVEDEEATTY